MRGDRLILAVALALSVLANLFLGGVVAGRWLAPRPGGAGAGGVAPMRNVRLLPGPERARFMAVMRDRREEVRAARREVRVARAQVAADIAAPAYDKARVQADFAALRQASAALQERSQAALVEALGQLSPASRAAVVARAQGGAARPPPGPPDVGDASVGNAAPAR